MKIQNLIVRGAVGLLMALGGPAFSETPVLEKNERAIENAYNSQILIPVAANSPGRFGAHYKTRVTIFNTTSRKYSITAFLYGPSGRVGRARDIPIDSSQYLVWDNFLGEVFNYTGSGAVSLLAPDPKDDFYVTAEVYTDSPNGRFGTTVLNGVLPRITESEGPEYNVGISVNQNRRTNIGVFNFETAVASSIRAKVFDAAGMLIQTIEFELKERAWQQKSITVPVDNGIVRWEINGPSGRHYFYAVEVDNRSNDGTLTWSVKGSSATGSGGQAPDLVFTAVRPSAITLVRGGPRVKAYYTLKNRGDGPSEPTKARALLSENSTITRGDFQIGVINIPRLSAGESGDPWIELNANSDAPLRTLYAGMCVDAVPDESDTSNNCSQAVTVTVVAASGQVAPSTDTDGVMRGVTGKISYRPAKRKRSP